MEMSRGKIACAVMAICSILLLAALANDVYGTIDNGGETTLYGFNQLYSEDRKDKEKYDCSGDFGEIYEETPAGGFGDDVFEKTHTREPEDELYEETPAGGFGDDVFEETPVKNVKDGDEKPFENLDFDEIHNPLPESTISQEPSSNQNKDGTLPVEQNASFNNATGSEAAGSKESLPDSKRQESAHFSGDQQKRKKDKKNEDEYDGEYDGEYDDDDDSLGSAAFLDCKKVKNGGAVAFAFGLLALVSALGACFLHFSENSVATIPTGLTFIFSMISFAVWVGMAQNELSDAASLGGGEAALGASTALIICVFCLSFINTVWFLISGQGTMVSPA